MAVFVLEDLQAAIEVMVFPKTMTDHGHKLADDAVVVVQGRVDSRDDQPKLIAMDIEPVRADVGRGLPAAPPARAGRPVRGPDRRPEAAAGRAPGRLAGVPPPRRQAGPAPPRRVDRRRRRRPSSPSSACCSDRPRSWPERRLDPRVTIAEQALRDTAIGSRVALSGRVYWTSEAEPRVIRGLASAWRSRSRPRTAPHWATPSWPRWPISAPTGPSRYEVGLLSKQAEAWVLITQARENGKLKGFSFSTLERIGGTPCVLIGLASVKRTAKRDTVLRAIMHDQLRRAVLAFPDEDVLVGTRFADAVRLRGLQARSNDIVPRPDHKRQRRGAGVGPAAGQALRRRRRRLRRPLLHRPPATGSQPEVLRPREPEARGHRRRRRRLLQGRRRPSAATRSSPSAGPWPKTSPSWPEPPALELARRASAGRRMVRAFTRRARRTRRSSTACSTWPGGPRRPATARAGPSWSSTGPAETARYWDVTLPAGARDGFRWPGLARRAGAGGGAGAPRRLRRALRRGRQGGAPASAPAPDALAGARTGGSTPAWRSSTSCWAPSTPGWAPASSGCSTTRPPCSPRSASPRAGGPSARSPSATRPPTSPVAPPPEVGRQLADVVHRGGWQA